jgi:hypothetical protein
LSEILKTTNTSSQILMIPSAKTNRRWKKRIINPSIGRLPTTLYCGTEPTYRLGRQAHARSVFRNTTRLPMSHGFARRSQPRDLAHPGKLGPPQEDERATNDRRHAAVTGTIKGNWSFRLTGWTTKQSGRCSGLLAVRSSQSVDRRRATALGRCYTTPHYARCRQPPLPALCAHAERGCHSDQWALGNLSDVHFLVSSPPAVWPTRACMKRFSTVPCPSYNLPLSVRRSVSSWCERARWLV